MFESIGRSWRMATTSYGILWHNKTLLLLPIMSMLAAALVLVSFVAPLFMTGTIDGWVKMAQDGQEVTGAQKVVMAVIAFLFYFCNFFVIVFFNSALVAGALRAIEGQPVSLSECLTAAGKRLPQIAGWAAVSAVVGMLLKMIENSHEKAGQFVSAILGAGWTVMTFFVVPTIVVDGLGPIGALKSSFSVISQQWGKALVGNFSLGLLSFLLLLPVFLVAGGVVYVGVSSGAMAVAIACIAAAVLLLVLGFAVTGAADMIFRALLFNFATGRTLPEDMDTEDLKAAFKTK